MRHCSETKRENGKCVSAFEVLGATLQMEDKRLLIIIPAYNEEACIVHVINNIRNICPQYDYLIINDGSSDNTVQVCKQNQFNFLDLPTNLGLTGAFITGVKYAYMHDYDAVIQFDADGQHRPEFIEPMLNRIKEGYDIVIGSRFINQKKEKSLRMIGSKMLTVAIKITTGKRVADPTSGMRMFSRKMIKEFAQNLNYGPEPDTVSYLLKNGAEISEVSVNMDERVAGESYLNLTNAAKYMVKMLISILFVQNFRKRG